MSPRRLLTARRDGAVWPFLVTVVAALATVPLPPATVHERADDLATLLAVVMVAPLALPVERARARSLAGVAAPWLWLLIATLLRYSEGGVSSKYGPLVLLSVLWLALHGTRPQLLVAVVGVGASFAVPALLVGAPQYPAGEYGRALMYVLVALIGGFMIQRLVADVRRRGDDIATLAEVAHTLASAPDAAATVCDAARRLADADVAVLVEATDDGTVLRTRCSSEADRPVLELRADAGPSLSHRVLRSGQAQFYPDVAEEPEVWRELAEDTGLVSLYLQPVISHQRALGVLGVGWRRAHPEPESRVRTALEVLASDAAAALERTAATARLEQQASTDPLTGALNRRAWDAALTREVHRAARSGAPLCMAMVDLDHFKLYNDRSGHAAGDDLLRRFAVAARRELRDVDVFARWGGEEFAVLLTSHRESEAEIALERVRAAVPDGQSCSVGATWLRPGDTPEDLVQRADAALYRAKRDGRDRLELA